MIQTVDLTNTHRQLLYIIYKASKSYTRTLKQKSPRKADVFAFVLLIFVSQLVHRRNLYYKIQNHVHTYAHIVRCVFN